MRAGTESRKKLIAAASLGVLALILMLRVLVFNGATAATPAAVEAPVAGAATPMAHGKATGKKAKPQSRSLDPELRYDWLQASEDRKYEGNARNIFQDQAEIPKPVDKGVTSTAKIEPQGPPPPPPPPPINLKFYGFANKTGGPKKIFLAQGEDIFIASEGDIINRRYKVLHIAPQSVEIEDVLNNNRQTIPLIQG